MVPDDWQISQMTVAAVLRELEFQVLEELSISSGRVDVLVHKRDQRQHIVIIREVKVYKSFGKAQEIAAMAQMMKYVHCLAETGTGYRPTAQTRIFGMVVTATDSTIWQKELTNLIDPAELSGIESKIAEFRSFIVTVRRFPALLKELGLVTRVVSLDQWL